MAVEIPSPLKPALMGAGAGGLGLVCLAQEYSPRIEASPSATLAAVAIGVVVGGLGGFILQRIATRL